MSAVDGWILVVYQGCAGAVIFGVAGMAASGGVPGRGQGLAGELNGMVRSTARAVRLWACPGPWTWRASSIATSMLHRAA